MNVKKLHTRSANLNTHGLKISWPVSFSVAQWVTSRECFFYLLMLQISSIESSFPSCSYMQFVFLQVPKYSGFVSTETWTKSGRCFPNWRCLARVRKVVSCSTSVVRLSSVVCTISKILFRNTLKKQCKRNCNCNYSFCTAFPMSCDVVLCFFAKVDILWRKDIFGPIALCATSSKTRSGGP